MVKTDWSNKEFISNVVAESTQYIDVLRKLGLREVGANHTTLKKWIAFHEIDCSHFSARLARAHGASRDRKLSAAQVLVSNSPHLSAMARCIVLRENLLPYQCECGNTGEWLGNPITLQLDHVNGDNKDHRLTNLRFLCPNCHAQTETWGNKKRS